MWQYVCDVCMRVWDDRGRSGPEGDTKFRTRKNPRWQSVIEEAENKSVPHCCVCAVCRDMATAEDLRNAGVVVVGERGSSSSGKETREAGGGSGTPVGTAEPVSSADHPILLPEIGGRWEKNEPTAPSTSATTQPTSSVGSSTATQQQAGAPEACRSLRFSTSGSKEFREQYDELKTGAFSATLEESFYYSGSSRVDGRRGGWASLRFTTSDAALRIKLEYEGKLVVPDDHVSGGVGGKKNLLMGERWRVAYYFGDG